MGPSDRRLVTCPSCGTKNRLPAFASGRVQCGSCQAVLVASTGQQTEDSKRGERIVRLSQGSKAARRRRWFDPSDPANPKRLLDPNNANRLVARRREREGLFSPRHPFSINNPANLNNPANPANPVTRNRKSSPTNPQNAGKSMIDRMRRSRDL